MCMCARVYVCAGGGRERGNWWTDLCAYVCVCMCKGRNDGAVGSVYVPI